MAISSFNWLSLFLIVNCFYFFALRIPSAYISNTYTITFIDKFNCLVFPGKLLTWTIIIPDPIKESYERLPQYGTSVYLNQSHNQEKIQEPILKKDYSKYSEARPFCCWIQSFHRARIITRKRNVYHCTWRIVF